jgi:hypothetical protein
VGYPEQPVAAAPQPPVARERKWLPTLGVFVVIAAVSLGGLFAAGEADETLAESDAGVDPGAEEGPPVVVAGTVSITPLEGWEVAERFQDPEGIRLTQGTATLDGLGFSFQGSPEQLFDEYVANVLRPQASQLRTAEQVEIVHLDAGFTAVRGFYFGVFGERNASIEGEVTTTLVPGGTGIVFDGWAETGSYQLVRDEVNHMVQGLRVS